jgi:hypothetical protein
MNLKSAIRVSSRGYSCRVRLDTVAIAHDKRKNARRGEEGKRRRLLREPMHAYP